MSDLSWANRHHQMVTKRVARELFDEGMALYAEARIEDGRHKSVKTKRARGHALQRAAFYLDPDLRFEAMEQP